MGLFDIFKGNKEKIKKKNYLLINFLLNTSSDIPLVSGIIKWTNKSCRIIINAKIPNTTPGPIIPNKNGTSEGIIAARTQCVDVPNDCP